MRIENFKDIRVGDEMTTPFGAKGVIRRIDPMFVHGSWNGFAMVSLYDADDLKGLDITIERHEPKPSAEGYCIRNEDYAYTLSTQNLREIVDAAYRNAENSRNVIRATPNHADASSATDIAAAVAAERERILAILKENEPWDGEYSRREWFIEHRAVKKHHAKLLAAITQPQDGVRKEQR